MDKQDFIDFQGKKIFYRIAGPKDKKVPCILFLHGSASNLGSVSYLIENLKQKYACFVFSFLGCGQSEGRFEDFSLEDRLAQTRFVVEFLKKKGYLKRQKFIVVGSSMGAHVASRFTEFENVSDLILRAPASYRKDYEKKKMNPNPGWLPWDKENKKWPWKPSTALEALKNYKGNLLIVKSENDEIIPEQMIREFYKRGEKARRKELKTIPNAPHQISNSESLSRQFLGIIENFIESD